MKKTNTSSSSGSCRASSSSSSSSSSVIVAISVVVSALASINIVNHHWARLLLGWMTAHRQVNHLGK